MTITPTEQRNIAVMNVETYGSKAEYIRLTFPGVTTDEEADEVFNDQMDSGFIQDITCGTYNGATDDFTPWLTTATNVLETIHQAIRDSDFHNFVASYHEDHPDDLAELEQWSNADYIREYTEVYEVFIIGDRVYVNMD